MATPISLSLRTAPSFLASGDYVAQTAAGYGDNNLNDGIEIPLASVEIQPDTPNDVARRLQDGTTRLTMLGRPQRNLRVSALISAAQLDALNRMMDSGRPWAVGAWYDHSTHWMSHFGGGGSEGSNFTGAGEIGDTDSDNIVRKSTSDYAPDPFVGDQRLSQRANTVFGKGRPKIVPGMIGGAILLESSRANIAVKAYASGGSGIWTPSGSAVRQRVGAGSPLSPGLGQTEKIILPFDAGTSYVASGTQTVVVGQPYCISVWVRGSGQVLLGAYEAGVLKVGIGSTELTEKWRRLTLTGYVPTATSMVVRLTADPAGVPGTVDTFGLQIEKGYGPSQSFMTYNTAPSLKVDGIYVSDQFEWSAYTFVAWVQWRNDADVKWLYSVLGAGTEHGAYISGNSISLRYKTGGQKIAFFSLPANGSWVQLGIVYRAALSGTNMATVSFFLNGAQIDQQQISDAIGLNGAAPNASTFYIGCDLGVTSPSYVALMMPMDACRLDERAWTATEFASDYALRTDAGYQRLMNLVEGRYFRPRVTATPDGSYVDRWNVTVDLSEIDVRRQSVR